MMEIKKINTPVFILSSLIVSYLISGGIITFLNRDNKLESYSGGIILFVLIGLIFLSSMAFRFLNKAVGIVLFVVAVIFTGVQVAKISKIDR